MLVGFDGSSSSRSALAYAFDCAQHRGARLLAVRVIEPESGDRDDGRLDEAVTRQALRYPGSPPTARPSTVSRGPSCSTAPARRSSRWWPPGETGR
ncbi:universal stress protein [Micromonospora sp. WMMB482]|uniref:universal stress protein n=1 Tax=Micromonospora sp. WMMB482 TaxID=2849653 RepID=UPI0020B3C404|nr:universal stress protein [Micromonospora sp. WMMB482]